MRFAAHIAGRYLRSRRGPRLLNRVTVIAVTGIALGVMVLDLTLAIMNGFHRELRRTFVDNMPMVTVVCTRPEGFTRLGADLDRIGTVPGVTAAAPFVRQEVIASYRLGDLPPQHAGAVVWGIDPDLQEAVTPLARHLRPRAASLAALRGRTDRPAVVVGAELAATLMVGLGDTLVLTAPHGELDLARMEAESRRFVVAGLLETGMYDFDARFIEMNLDQARDFFGYPPGGATAIGVRCADMFQAPAVADSIAAALGRYDYHCNDWIDLNANLFQWVKIEKVVMFLLLALIVLVAAFNIIGILTMMVGERRREIGILLAMGARPGQVRGIFLLAGLAVGGLGTAAGSLLGWLGTVFLDRVGVPLPGDVYFVDHVPVVAQASDFLLVAAVAVGITLLATLVPSSEAARTRPMEIIRYT